MSAGARAQPPSEAAADALTLRYRQENVSIPAFTPSAASKSTYEARRREVEVLAWPVRVLSLENEPRLVLLALSSPRLSLTGAGRRGAQLDVPEYSLRHTLIARDAGFDEIGRVSDWQEGQAEDISTFTLRHVDTTLTYTVLAEVFSAGGGRSEPVLLASAQTVIENPEPLGTDPDSLEMSDVLTGIEIPQNYVSDKFQFPILPSRKIWLPDPVKVYLEVYHLALGEDGLARIRTEFEVVPVTAFGEAEAARTLTLSLDFESDADRRAVAIDVSNVPAGAYYLRVKVIDLLSGQSAVRLVPLEVAEPMAREGSRGD
jgi:hypothetical protein